MSNSMPKTFTNRCSHYQVRILLFPWQLHFVSKALKSHSKSQLPQCLSPLSASIPPTQSKHISIKRQGSQLLIQERPRKRSAPSPSLPSTANIWIRSGKLIKTSGNKNAHEFNFKKEVSQTYAPSILVFHSISAFPHHFVACTRGNYGCTCSKNPDQALAW